MTDRPRGRPPVLPDAVWAKARALYERGVRPVEIVERLNLKASTLAGRIRRGGWMRPGGVSQRGGTRTQLVRRLYRAVERQICALEQRVDGQLGEPPADERDVRLLAALAQTLQRLAALDGRSRPAKRARPATEAATEAGDLDGFRQDLARRLAALAAAGDRGVAGDPEPQRDRPPGA